MDPVVYQVELICIANGADVVLFSGISFVVLIYLPFHWASDNIILYSRTNSPSLNKNPIKLN